MRKTNVLGLGTNKIRGNDLVYRQTLTLGLYLHTKGCQLSIGLSLYNEYSCDSNIEYRPSRLTLTLAIDLVTKS